MGLWELVTGSRSQGMVMLNRSLNWGLVNRSHLQSFHREYSCLDREMGAGHWNEGTGTGGGEGKGKKLGFMLYGYNILPSTIESSPQFQSRSFIVQAQLL